ncbi:MAG: IS3 family transposase [Emcibacteraceae bacterium]|nr:IS3 family transposase [Emcibacteraceae bacterium]
MTRKHSNKSNKAGSAEKTVKDIRRATRRNYGTEEKIRIVLEGLRGEHSIAELCRIEGINQNLYYRWSKDFLEAGKKRLSGDTEREANTTEVKGLRTESRQLKEALAEQVLENRLLKKHDRGWGRRYMRYSASEKVEIIQLVENSHLPLKRTLQQLGISRSTWYNWYDRYLEDGVDGLKDRKPIPKSVWNKIPTSVKGKIISLALKETEMSPRELSVFFTETQSYYISEASVYRILKAEGLITSPAFILMKAADKFQNPTTAVNQLWQTDFTYFKIIGWGWFYLSTVLDDYSRYIVSWKLCTSMTSKDASDTLEIALKKTGFDNVKLKNRPRLLSDNGPSYISSELADWLDDHNMEHTRGRPYHPQTQGKIERWHRSLKNQILLENYYFPSELKQRIEDFIQYYNTRRYHESINNLTPEDVFLGRGNAILEKRNKIKLKTMAKRKRLHKQAMAA